MSARTSGKIAAGIEITNELMKYGAMPPGMCAAVEDLAVVVRVNAGLVKTVHQPVLSAPARAGAAR